MKISIIILNWNGLKLLQEFLPTASRHTRGDDVQLVVADNGSDDDSVAWIRANHPEVRVVELGQNYGFAEGYNRAIDLLNPPGQPPVEFSLLLNSDVEVTDGWWQPLLKYMEENPDVGALQPKILSYHDRGSFEYAGAAGGYLDRLGYPYCRGRLFDSIERDEGQYDGPAADVCWASGAALMVRTEVYQKLGGLDPKFFAHMEEIDLCCRMHAAGWRVCALSDSHVYHVGGASLNQGNPRKTYLNFRNNLLLLHKNLPRRRGRKVLFWRRLADTLAFGMFVAKLDFPNARAILKAHNDFRRMRREYTDFPATDTLSTLPGSHRWIVLDRYLLRRRK